MKFDVYITKTFNMETQSQDFRLTWVNYSQKLTESFHKFLTSEILCNVTLWVHNGTSSTSDGIGGGPTGSNSIKVHFCIRYLEDWIVIHIKPIQINTIQSIALIILLSGTSSYFVSMFTMVWRSSFTESAPSSCYNTQRCTISRSQKYN